MKTFKALKALNEYRRRHLPFLRTIEDLELVREIGLHDKRILELTVSPDVWKVYQRMGRLMRKALA